MNDPCALSAVALGRLYRSGDLSPVEVTRAVLDRIERLDPDINAFIEVQPERALAAAAQAEADLLAGIDRGRLQGIPVSVKDLIRIKGTRTTAASRSLADAAVDREDAAVIQRLATGGAVLLGKANLREFALGAPDPDSPFGEVQNPRRIGYQTGGSSSGSAAAVAAGFGPVSLGTDTGGSIRYPACLCGIVGLKPTNGLVPLDGVVPLSERFDVVGPLTRCVADAAATLDVIADPDRRIASFPSLDRDIRGLRLGIPTNPFYGQGRREALALQAAAQEHLRALGLELVPLDVPRPEQVYDTWDRLMSADMAAIHGRLGLDETLYGHDFRKRLAQGRAIGIAELEGAQAAGATLKHDWLALFQRIDLLALPGNWAPAAPYGVDTLEVDGRPYPSRVLFAPSNRIANLIGCPALALPVGAVERLPVGMQLMGAPFSEPLLLAVGHALEAALGNLVQGWGIDPVRA